MKVTFFSNFLNHHQLPLSLEMINKGIDYTFVATEPVPEERIKLGYENMNDMYDFVLKTYESNDNYQKAMKLAKECGDKLNNAEEAVNKILSEDGTLKDFHIENA